MVARRLSRIGVSQTLAISAQAKAMKRDGIDVIDFSVGEPDFPTPAPIKDAGKRAIDENFTRYTAAAGIPELRQAVSDKLARDNGVRYAPEQVILSSGAKHSLFNICMALVDPGDEVIIPAPYWLSYPPMVYLAGGEPVILETREEDNYLLTPEALQAAVGPRTRAIFLNNPSNPTGMMYAPDHLEALARIAVKNDVWIIADEIYEKLVYDGTFACVASLGEDVYQKTLTVNGVSKAYSMTGWRIGYAAGPVEVITAMTKVQSQTTSAICSISQRAAVEALTGDQSVVDEMVAVFRTRRDHVVPRLRAIPGVACQVPHGAFYVFPNMASFYPRLPAGKKDDPPSVRLAAYLLDAAQTAVVPGIAFGAPDNIRFSYAASLEDIERGLDRVEKALRAL